MYMIGNCDPDDTVYYQIICYWFDFESSTGFSVFVNKDKEIVERSIDKFINGLKIINDHINIKVTEIFSDKYKDLEVIVENAQKGNFDEKLKFSDNFSKSAFYHESQKSLH